jgi:hypothetical protein
MRHSKNTHVLYVEDSEAETLKNEIDKIKTIMMNQFGVSFPRAFPAVSDLLLTLKKLTEE